MSIFPLPALGYRASGRSQFRLPLPTLPNLRLGAESGQAASVAGRGFGRSVASAARSRHTRSQAQLAVHLKGR